MFIQPSEGRITSPFGPRTHPVTGAKGTMHWGVDYGKDAGTRIIASAAGTVTYAKSTNGYGNTIMIEHTLDGKLYTTVYAHLASIGVKLGQKVKQGETIAVMGTTGTSTGVHLHFEVHTGKWNNKFTNAVDPLKYIVNKEVEPVQKTRFSDVGTSHSAYAALERIADKNIINGFTDGTFRPNEPVTRGQIAIIADRIIQALKG